MNKLDQKINEHFAGLVVRKDLVKIVRGNAIVPTYVLEYLLGQYCATSDEASIQSGIETVREILRRHYVHRNEANLVKSTIREKGHHKVIDKISVVLNEKIDAYEAAFARFHKLERAYYELKALTATKAYYEFGFTRTRRFRLVDR